MKYGEQISVSQLALPVKSTLFDSVSKQTQLVKDIFPGGIQFCFLHNAVTNKLLNGNLGADAAIYTSLHQSFFRPLDQASLSVAQSLDQSKFAVMYTREESLAMIDPVINRINKGVLPVDIYLSADLHELNHVNNGTPYVQIKKEVAEVLNIRQTNDWAEKQNNQLHNFQWIYDTQHSSRILPMQEILKNRNLKINRVHVSGERSDLELCDNFISYKDLLNGKRDGHLFRLVMALATLGGPAMTWVFETTKYQFENNNSWRNVMSDLTGNFDRWLTSANG